MPGPSILVVSDDADARDFYLYGFGQRGISAKAADLTTGSFEQYLVDAPDLIIIDVQTALDDALTLCRRLRTAIVNPILFLSYASAEPDILRGYEAGADECIVKPIGRGLMRAKIRAWLRRSWTVSTDVLSPLDAAGLRLDPGQRQLSTPAGATIKLTNLEVRLLYLLMSHPGQVFRSEEIVARVWGYDTDQEGALIKHLVYRVRQKVEPAPGHPRYVQTADGGYIFPRS